MSPKRDQPDLEFTIHFSLTPAELARVLKEYTSERLGADHLLSQGKNPFFEELLRISQEICRSSET